MPLLSDHAADQHGGRFPLPLAWHVYFLSYGAGLLALEHPAPALAALGLIALLAWPRIKAPGRVLALGLAFMLGLGATWLATPRFPEPSSLTEPWMAERQKVLIQGRVERVDALYGGRLRAILRDVTCTLEDGDAEALEWGLNWTWQYPRFRPLPGQEVALQARIYPVHAMADPGAWDTERYWFRQGVAYRCYTHWDEDFVELAQDGSAPWDQWRAALMLRVADAMGEERDLDQGRAVVLALLFGDRLGVDEATAELMARANLSHTLALSGLHVGFVALLGFWAAQLAGLLRPKLFLRIPRARLAVFLAAPLVVLYLWLGDFSPSLLRAGIMFLFWGALLLMNRERVLLDGLFLALALILVVSPLAVHDLRLQLSAAAVAGIAAYVELSRPLRGRMRAWAGKRLWRRPLAWALDLMGVSLAANLATLPLVVESFGFLAPNLLGNVLWLPLLGLVVMPLSLCGLALAAIPGAETAAGALFSAAAWIIDHFLALLQWLQAGGWLAVFLPPRPSWPARLGWWTLLACSGLWLAARKYAAKGRGFRRGLAVAAALGLVLCVFPLAREGLRQARGQVRLTLLDVGQGQSVVLEAPGGCRLLVDGGGSFAKEFDVGEAVVAKVLTRDRCARLHGVILSHPELDHVRGVIYPLTWFRVGFFAHNGRWPGGEWDLEQLRGALGRSGVERRVWAAGHAEDLGEGLVLEVLHPAPDFESGAENDHSLVLRLVWRGQGLALMPGDVESKGIGALLESGRDLHAGVLVLPHHGSRSSLSPEFYAAVDPDLALASCGHLNMWGFPAQAVREALAGQGVRLMGTDEWGAVRLTWDAPGSAPRVETIRLSAGGAVNQAMR